MSLAELAMASRGKNLLVDLCFLAILFIQIPTSESNQLQKSRNRNPLVVLLNDLQPLDGYHSNEGRGSSYNNERGPHSVERVHSLEIQGRGTKWYNKRDNKGYDHSYERYHDKDHYNRNVQKRNDYRGQSSNYDKLLPYVNNQKNLLQLKKFLGDDSGIDDDRYDNNQYYSHRERQQRRRDRLWRDDKGDGHRLRDTYNKRDLNNYRQYDNKDLTRKKDRQRYNDYNIKKYRYTNDRLKKRHDQDKYGSKGDLNRNLNRGYSQNYVNRGHSHDNVYRGHSQNDVNRGQSYRDNNRGNYQQDYRGNYQQDYRGKSHRDDYNEDLQKDDYREDLQKDKYRGDTQKDVYRGYVKQYVNRKPRRGRNYNHLRSRLDELENREEQNQQEQRKDQDQRDQYQSRLQALRTRLSKNLQNLERSPVKYLLRAADDLDCAAQLECIKECSNKKKPDPPKKKECEETCEEEIECDTDDNGEDDICNESGEDSCEGGPSGTGSTKGVLVEECKKNEC